MNVSAKLQENLPTPSKTENDIEAIKSAMRRYTWSLDMKDWDRLEDVFTPDIDFDTSDMGKHVGAANLVEKFQSRVQRVPVRRHAVYNPYVKVDGDTAVFTSYLLNSRQRPRAPGGGEFGLAGGYYRNSFVRTSNGWKMSALRWHGYFMEGNMRLDPTLAPTPYIPVMQGPVDAPWGGANAAGGSPDVSDMLQIKDLMTSFVRAADARAKGDVVAALDTGATADLQGKGAVKGAEVIADAFCAPAGAGFTMHVLSNEKVSVVGGEAQYGAYVYRITSEDGKATNHSGGFMIARIVRGAAGWRIADCTIHFLWEKGKPLFQDPLVQRADVAGLTRRLWASEATRKRGTVEDEVTALLWKYTWSFDLNDKAQNETCFADDVDVSITLDTTVRHFGREDWIKANLANRSRQMVTLHYVSNVVVTKCYNPDLAELKAYVMTRRTAPGDPGPVLVAGGQYTGVAKRVDGEWKFIVFGFQRSHGAYE